MCVCVRVSERKVCGIVVALVSPPERTLQWMLLRLALSMCVPVSVCCHQEVPPKRRSVVFPVSVE